MCSQPLKGAPKVHDVLTSCVVTPGPKASGSVGPTIPLLLSQRYVTVPDPLTTICPVKVNVVGHILALATLTLAVTPTIPKTLIGAVGIEVGLPVYGST